MTRRTQHRIALLAWLLLPALALWLLNLPERFSTDLLDLAPSKSLENRDAQAMRGANQVLARQVFVTVEGVDGETQRKQVGAWFQDFAVTEPVFSSVFIPDERAFPPELVSFLQKRKLALLLPSWLERRQAEYEGDEDDWLEWLAQKQATALDRFLESPYGAEYASQITEDPLLILPDTARQLQKAKGDTDAESNGPLLVWLGLSVNPLNSEDQEAISAAVSTLTDSFRKAFPAYELEVAGVYQVAQETSAAAQSEVARLNTLTALAVVLLLVVFMRRVRSILTLLLPLLAAVLWALLGGLVCFEKIHVFALAMSAVLLGLAVDYGLHAEMHRLNQKGEGTVWQRVRRPLLAGCLSTCFGFLVILETPIPALRQVAVLVPSGLLGAMGAVYWLYATAKPIEGDGPGLLTYRLPRLSPVLVLGCGLGLVLLSAVYLILRFEVRDTVDNLQLEAGGAQDRLQRVLEVAQGESIGQQWVLYAEDAEELFDGMSAISAQTDAPVFPFSKVLHPTDPIVLSESQRTAFSQAFQEQLEDKGFETSEFASFFSEFEATNPREVFAPAVIELTDYLPGPLGLTLGYHEGVFFSVFSSASAPVTSVDHKSWAVTPLAEKAELDRLISKASHTLMWQCSWAWALVLVVLMIFFGWRHGLQIGLLPLWACLCGAAFQLLFLGSFSLMSWLGLVLAYCLALDYAAFASKERGQPLPSVRLSAITTITAFALLATSEIPALHVLGFSVAMSVFIALVGVELLNASQGKDA